MGDIPLVVHFGRVARDCSGRLRDGTRHAEWCEAAVRSTRPAALPQSIAPSAQRPVTDGSSTGGLETVGWNKEGSIKQQDQGREGRETDHQSSRRVRISGDVHHDRHGGDWNRQRSPGCQADLGRFRPGRLECQQPSIARRSGSARARHDMTVHPCAKGGDSQQHQNSNRAEGVN
jgi:hypothetical protein